MTVLLLLSAAVVHGDEAPFAEPQTLGPAQQADLSGTALRVNNDALTSKEIVDLLGDQLKPPSGDMNQQKYMAYIQPVIVKLAMEKIYQLLVYQHAKSILEKNENFESFIKAALENERKNLIARYAGSAARAQQELAAEGKSIESQLELLKRQLITESFRETYFTPNLTITRSQMLQYYNKNQKDKYEQDPSIQFQLIDIHFDAFKKDAPSPDQAKQQACQTAQQALEQINGGDDFADVARQFSNGFQKNNGGLWRPINPNSLQEQYAPVLKALNELSANQCTGIIEGEGRYFIAKLIDNKQEKVTSFPEVQSDIADEIRQQRWMQYSQKLGEKLLKKATVGDLNAFVIQTADIAYQQCNKQ